MNLCPRCLATFPAAVTACPLDGVRLVDEDPLIGQEVGSYHLEALLGAGGMARVYRARHRVLDRVYALKMQTQRSRPEHEARFIREAKIIAQLDHPNVVEVHDFGFTPEGRPYLVMEPSNSSGLSSKLGSQDELTQVLILRDLFQPLFHIRSVDFDAAHLHVGGFEREFFEQSLKDGVETPSTDVLCALVYFEGVVGEGVDGVGREFYVDTFRLEQCGVLLCERTFRLG